MTASSPRTKRRWRWIAASLAILIAGSSAFSLWRSNLEADLEAWLVDASGHTLNVSSQRRCLIRQLQSNEFCDGVLGTTRVYVGVTTEEDAANLLSMPPCPVPMTVVTLASTPVAVVKRLRDYFGSENVQ